MPQYQWIPVPKVSLVPLQNAVTVYTDAGKWSRRAAATWQERGQWCHQILSAEPEDSLQTLELLAVVWALSRWLQQPINIVTDSLYVAGIATRIEGAQIKDIANKRLYQLL
ncbi:PO113 protein, partial [Pomatorhinus ruficollis]|nr:PO113 protein [Pomatorhinus ruficollis]